MKKILIILLCLILISGCKSTTNSNNTNTISYIEAKEKIINEGAILVDVRTEDEYNEKHIDGAVLLSLDNISEESAGNIFSSKDVVIIVYCKSGNRSKQALDKLNDLGYANVYDLGSIDNWSE